jgi:FkbM family methyltransferase
MPRKRLLDVAGLLLLIPGFGLAAYRFVPQFRASVLLLAGRGPNCTWEKAVQADGMIREHVHQMEALAAASRVVRQDGPLKLVETPRGAFWIPKGDNDVLMSLLAEQDRKIYGEGETGVQPGDVVIDCGAHVGAFTREALKAGAKLVVAVEPAPDNIAALRRNLAPEIAAGRVVVVEKGVWKEEGRLTFHVDPENSAADSIVFGDQPAQPGDFQIAVTTIDRLVDELFLPRVDFIKMDIEGSERHALAGARETLKSFHPRMALCTYHLPDDPVVLPAAVQAIAPQYRFECGPCGEQDARIIPHTLLFR